MEAGSRAILGASFRSPLLKFLERFNEGPSVRICKYSSVRNAQATEHKTSGVRGRQRAVTSVWLLCRRMSGVRAASVHMHRKHMKALRGTRNTAAGALMQENAREYIYAHTMLARQLIHIEQLPMDTQFGVPQL